MQKSSSDLFSRIFESSREFKKVTTITTCAMFGALSVVLGYYSFKITPNLKIGFGSIPNMLVDYLFGPVVGGLFGGAMDVIKFMLKPDGGFMPGFTFNAMLAAFIYGLFFYKKNLSLPRILTAKLVVIVLCNIVLGTYWLTLLNGKGFLAILPARAIKNLIQGVVAGDGHLIAHGARQSIRHTGEQPGVRAALLLQLVQGADIGLSVPASGIHAVALGTVIAVAQFIEGHHIRPHLVNIHALAEVEHIRRIAPRRAHVDLQGHNISPLAQSRFVLRQAEKLQVEKPAGGTKGPQHRLARRFHIGGNRPIHIVIGRDALVDHIHDGIAGDMAGGKEHLALGIASCTSFRRAV